MSAVDESGPLPEITVMLGETPVHLAVTERPPSSVSFINVHENEQTAVTAARQMIELRGGRFIRIKSRGRREVSFLLNKARFAFDPNRIFTDVGLEKSLRHYGRYSPEAHQTVAKLRDCVIGLLRQRPSPIIAVHNNAGNGVSVDSYKPGGLFVADAARVARNPNVSPHVFLLVLDSELFERLKTFGFNVVLQSRNPTNDGSLSVFCQNAGLQYVNVESQYGDVPRQRAILEALYSLIPVRFP